MVRKTSGATTRRMYFPSASDGHVSMSYTSVDNPTATVSNDDDEDDVVSVLLLQRNAVYSSYQNAREGRKRDHAVSSRQTTDRTIPGLQ